MQELVYGVLEERDDEVVFVPVARAEELADIYAVMRSVRTYGELQDSILHEDFADLASREFGAASTGADTYDTFSDVLKATIRGTPFDHWTCATIADGIWPEWPQRSMIGWVPQEIQERWGTRQVMPIGDDCLTFAQDDVRALIAAFARHGYTCIEDIDLVRRATGLEVW
jgi:hypothetical protein